MKKLSFLMAALLVAMTGCQKEPQVTDGNAEGNNYVSVKISLPSTLETKADENPGHNENYDDGDENEYKISDYTVIFYANEKYAEHFSYNTTTTTPKDPTDDNITASFTMGPVKINNPNINSALVLINANALFPDVASYKLDFAKMQEKVFEAQTNMDNIIGNGKDDFFMSNTLKWDGTKFYSLVTVEPKKTEAEATAAAATIQVERAAAKVQVAYNTSVYPVGAENNQVTILGWEIDNTNKKFFPVRNGDSSWWNTDAWVNLGIQSANRINFAADPNYNETIVDFSNEFNRIGTPADEYIWKTSGNHTYCLENTFSTDFMKNGYTTRVVFKAKYLPTNPKYGEGEVALSDGTWFMVGTGQQSYSEKALKEAIVATGETAPSTWETDENGLVTNIPTNAAAVLGEVYYYKEGVCYYPAYIRHFISSEHKTSTQGYDNENYWRNNYATAGYQSWDLGRYGVVRNNWYKLTLNSISAPGTPVVPTPDPEIPDDPTKLYVDCNVEILAWNVRNHIIDL